MRLVGCLVCVFLGIVFCDIRPGKVLKRCLLGAGVCEETSEVSVMNLIGVLFIDLVINRVVCCLLFGLF